MDKLLTGAIAGLIFGVIDVLLMIPLSINDKSTAICPLCHGNAGRLFSPVPIIFKGPGFYVTDCRIETERKKPDKAAKDDGNSQGR